MSSQIPNFDDDLGPFYQALGRFVVVMSATDAFLGTIILRMISPGENALTPALPLVAGSDFRVKLAIIRNLGAFHGATDLQRIRKACDTLQDMYQRRNELAHSIITKGKSAGQVMVRDFRMNAAGEMHPAKPLSIVDVERWFSKSEKAIRDLDRAITAEGYATAQTKVSPELLPRPVREKLELLAAQRRIAPPTNRRRQPPPEPSGE